MARIRTVKNLTSLCLAMGFLVACHAQTEGEMPSSVPPGMIAIPAAQFTMGGDGDDALPEERPAHPVAVDEFWIDRTEVTNAQFAEFVAATGYVTTSEQPIPLETIMAQLPPGSEAPSAEQLAPGSAVFVQPDGNGAPGYWTYVHGAQWRHPEGPGSSIEGRENHPVVQVTWWDAQAYARWAGKSLPTEAQWECAARGGLEAARYVWGANPPDPETPPLNMWQGRFPAHNTQSDGFAGSAPVASYAPNGFGLHDMAGNVWEWCIDHFDARAYAVRSRSAATQDPLHLIPQADEFAPRAMRGGSFLCSDDYCTRYRPSARTGNSPDSATNHTGFRCVWTPTKR